VADEVVPCPSCGLQLVKGDGCNSITCLCGESFNWARIVQDMQVREQRRRQHGLMLG
jgi:hypothetical protein